MADPTLLAYLLSSLSTLPCAPSSSARPTSAASLKVEIMISTPRRSYALFPHSTNAPRTKIFQSEILVRLSELVDFPDPSANDAADTTTTTTAPLYIPIFALESVLYTIPSTQTCLLYVSKIDSTGLSSLPVSPAQTLVSSFLAFHLLFPPKGTTRVRVHTFAKSQGQYLFPGSIENKGKKVLGGAKLCRWWKKVLETTERKVQEQNKGEGGGAGLYCLLPGLTEVESTSYLPSSGPSSPKWHYTHAFSLPSPLFAPSSSPSAPSSFPIIDLLPSFPDDPKSRFLHSLTSSTIPPAGSPGDYDDRSFAISSAVNSSSSRGWEELEKERGRERTRLAEVSMHEWWERMAWRQECTMGDLVAFFAVVREVETGHQSIENDEGDGKSVTVSTTTPIPSLSIPHSSFTKLWSQFHHVDYAINLPPTTSSSSPSSASTLPTPLSTPTQFSKFKQSLEKWDRDFKSIVVSEGHFEGGEGEGDEGKKKEEPFARECRGFVELSAKRVREDDGEGERVESGLGLEEMKEKGREAEKKVNVMVPRKKVKTTA